ncbi:hypothetical protein [Actinacidiphila acidipaludis]|uniref:Uncharacterized protein n=1 Tax=Actinacidiphila acidipaludis TaxID=2873382 RepID=A0ABS7QCW0_9ACTN|nr:hypothetical protein [Streptomyces acidipaludis]MBY8879812.1 hypothetical protein [Streptomyces acidipaludis]
MSVPAAARPPHARARAAGVRSAALVALLAASVAACVSTGGSDPKAPGRPPVSGKGGAADARHAVRGFPAGGHGGGRDGMSPSPAASGTATAGASAVATTPASAPGRTGTRAVPPGGGATTAPHPTVQPSPTGDGPTTTPTPTDPATTTTPADPPPTTATPGDGGDPSGAGTP